jgi:hypothetical protein
MANCFATDRSVLGFSFSLIVYGAYFEIDHFITHALFPLYLLTVWGAVSSGCGRF